MIFEVCYILLTVVIISADVTYRITIIDKASKYSHVHYYADGFMILYLQAKREKLLKNGSHLILT